MRCPFRLRSFAVWVGLWGTALAGEGVGMPELAEPAKTGQKSPKDAAVVIGVEDYTDVPDVPYARRDAVAFDTFLRYTRGIPDDRVALLRDARAFEIEKAVKAAGERVGPGGRVWVYFAGHGAMEPNGTARLLLGRDAATDPEAFGRFAVSVDDIREWATAGGGETVLVIDACYNGGGRTGEGVLAGGRRMAVPDYAMEVKENASEWASTGPKELSQPLDAVEHGAFTYFAVGALRGWADGEVDGSRDGNVTGEEANRYVSRALRSIQTQGQTPQLASDDGAALVLARGVKEVGPGKELLLALRDAGSGAARLPPGPPYVWAAADDQVLAAMEAGARAAAGARGKAEQDAEAAQRVGARQAAVAAEWRALQAAVGTAASASTEASAAVRTKLEGWKADAVEVPGRRVALTGSVVWNGRTKDLSRLSEDVTARKVAVVHPTEIAAAEAWLVTAKVAVVSGAKKVEVAPVATLSGGGGASGADFGSPTGDHKVAAMAYETGAELPNVPDAEVIYWKAGEHWELVDPTQAISFYERYLRNFPPDRAGFNASHAIIAHSKLSDLYLAKGDKRKAAHELVDLDTTFRENVSQGVNSDAHRLAALAPMRALVGRLEAFRSFRWSTSEKANAELVLTQKPEELRELRDDALQLSQTYQDYDAAAAALYVEGAAYFAYSDMVYAYPLPPGLDEEERQLFEDLIDEKFSPIRFKAEDWGKARLGAALEKARADERWSTWNSKALELLHERFPAEFPSEH